MLLKIRWSGFKNLRLLSLVMILLLSGCSETDSQTVNGTEGSEINPYSLGRAGNPENVEALPKAGVLLMGGSTDVDEAMEWLIEQSGNGDIVIIRASGGAGYNQYLYSLGSVNSVETLLINSDEAANDERVATTIRDADALFIAGGNQADYIRLWENSKTEDAIQYLIHDKKVTIGGTSAGSAIMGEFVYTALNGGVTSEEALNDPFDSRVTLSKSGLVNHPVLAGVVADQHFSQRDRQGRAAVFLARIIEQYGDDGGQNLFRALAVDERTALVVEETGNMKVMGENRVFFIYPMAEGLEPENMTAGQPFTWSESDYSLNVYIANEQTEIEHLFEEKPKVWNEKWKISKGQLIRTIR